MASCSAREREMNSKVTYSGSIRSTNALTPGQVKIRLHRLRQRLKKRLAEKEGDL